MSIQYPPVIDKIFFSDDGKSPLANGFVRAFYTGVSTLAPTYNHSDNANANPIVLDDSGRCQFKLSTDIAYDIKTYDSNNALVETFENVRIVASGGAGSGAFDLVGQGLEIVGTDPNRTLQLTNGIISAINGKVSKSGDTMTGDLVNTGGGVIATSILGEDSLEIKRVLGRSRSASSVDSSGGRSNKNSADGLKTLHASATNSGARVDAGCEDDYIAIQANDGDRATYLIISSLVDDRNTVLDLDSLRIEDGEVSAELFNDDLQFNGVSIFDTFKFDTTPESSESLLKGEERWNATEGTLDLGLGDGVTQSIGQELPHKAKNVSGSDFLDGQIGYIVGSAGQRISIGKSVASDYTAMKALFMATQPIASNNTGFFNCLGIVRNINTIGFDEGDEVWLDVVSGSITKTAPAKPNYQASMGYVVISHSTNGAIFFHPRTNPKIGDLSDADTSSSVRGDFLTKGADGVFKQNVFWDDWRWAGSAVNPAGAPVPAVLTQVATDEWHWVFTNNSTLVFPDQQIPHSYKEGTDIYPHIHFTSISGGTHIGTWTAVFSLWNGGSGGSKKTTYTKTVSFSTPLVAGVERILSFDSAINGLNRKISSCGTITLKLSLTSGSGLILLGFDGHFEKDRFGSNEITTK